MIITTTLQHFDRLSHRAKHALWRIGARESLWSTSGIRWDVVLDVAKWDDGFRRQDALWGKVKRDNVSAIQGDALLKWRLGTMKCVGPATAREIVGVGYREAFRRWDA